MHILFAPLYACSWCHRMRTYACVCARADRDERVQGPYTSGCHRSALHLPITPRPHCRAERQQRHSCREHGRRDTHTSASRACQDHRTVLHNAITPHHAPSSDSCCPPPPATHTHTQARTHARTHGPLPTPMLACPPSVHARPSRQQDERGDEACAAPFWFCLRLAFYVTHLTPTTTPPVGAGARARETA